jgi:hypothetical protein
VTYLIGAHHEGKLQDTYFQWTIHRYNLRQTPSRTLREELALAVYRPENTQSVVGTFKEVPEYLSTPLSPLSDSQESISPVLTSQ